MRLDLSEGYSSKKRLCTEPVIRHKNNSQCNTLVTIRRLMQYNPNQTNRPTVHIYTL